MRAHFVSLSLAALLVACGSSDNSGGGGTANTTGGTGGNAACETMAEDACLTCCGDIHTSGVATYNKTVDACACDSGPCVTECADLCNGGSASNACASCVDAAIGKGTCSSDPCATDADCQAYSLCGNACVSGSMTTSSASSTGSSSDPLAQARHDCVAAINADRATLNLPAYTEWTAEETCADGQAQSDSASMMAHGAFGKCGESAQDECPGWAGPPDTMITQCLAMMWAEGPGSDFSTHGHYINMSSTSYAMVSCGFYTLPNGSVWAVQDFK
jgi:hypothetical protein